VILIVIPSELLFDLLFWVFSRMKTAGISHIRSISGKGERRGARLFLELDEPASMHTNMLFRLSGTYETCLLSGSVTYYSYLSGAGTHSS
jgi:hypothetical protein